MIIIPIYTTYKEILFLIYFRMPLSIPIVNIASFTIPAQIMPNASADSNSPITHARPEKTSENTISINSPLWIDIRVFHQSVKFTVQVLRACQTAIMSFRDEENEAQGIQIALPRIWALASASLSFFKNVV